MTDLMRKYKSLYSSTTNTFSTGESVTITPASVVGLPTDTEITLTFDRVDATGTKTPDKMERIRGTISGSNFVVSASSRAVEGTEQVHTSPVVEMVWNADDLNDMVDWGLVEHGQDGKHTSALVTTLKASGAVVNTGTSDVTIVTPKALADSKVSVIDKAETLTNKTLTSPKINEDVALTATATELNKLDNIVFTNGAWTSFDPTISNFVIGSGTKSGYYCQIGKVVHFRVKVALAANSTMGSLPTLTLPVTKNADYATYQPIGLASFFNATNVWTGSISSNGQLFFHTVSGTSIQWLSLSATTPFTWGNTHTFYITGTYEAA